MDTSGIRLFVIAAELLNISAAGNRLRLSPSVASARLSKLELQIGADLFHRSTRKVTLSVEGAQFLPYAKEIIAQEEAAFAALGKGNPKIGGTLRFAASSTKQYTFPPTSGKCRVICDDGASMRIAAKAGIGICMSSLNLL